jgi:hypothetical protein
LLENDSKEENCLQQLKKFIMLVAKNLLNLNSILPSSLRTQSIVDTLNFQFNLIPKVKKKGSL